MTNPPQCPACKGYDYHHTMIYGGWLCYACGCFVSTRQKFPPWMRAMGGSQVERERTPGGGEDDGVLEQT